MAKLDKDIRLIELLIKLESDEYTMDEAYEALGITESEQELSQQEYIKLGKEVEVRCA